MNHKTEEGPAVHELRGELKKSIGSLRQLRDEIRLELHLAGMEARDRWVKTLEPRFREIERLAREAGEVSRRTVDDLARELKDYQESMKRER